MSIHHIAIIDDSPEDREIYKYHLGKHFNDVNFIEFKTAQEALAFDYQKANVQCILLDYNLPDLNGIEVLKKTQFGGIPIILLTGQGSETVAVEAFKLGVCDYLIKSHITDELMLKAIRTAVQAYMYQVQLKAQHQKIAYQATHDPLTHLYNRQYFEESCQQLLAQTKRHAEHFAILFIDLDRFKMINDTLGHHIGDRVLIEFARRIKISFRQEDIACRSGGDEFIVLMRDLHNPFEVARIAEKLIKSLTEPMMIEHKKINISTSIGIYYHDHAKNDQTHQNLTYERILNNADKALYSVKKNGKNSFQFFSTELENQYNRKTYIESRLKDALKNNEFYLVYQAQYDVRTQKTTGFEALLRWQEPTLGLIGPSEFIPIAEETAMIHDLGLWVIEAVADLLKHNRIPDDIKMSVNLSSFQLRSDDLVSSIQNIFKFNQQALQNIEFEITESGILNATSQMTNCLEQLTRLGCSLAIDDFGMGYSSLHHLSCVKFKTLKIDQSFIKDISNNQRNQKIVHFIKSLGESLGACVVFEGIENKADEVIVSHLGLHAVGQGFYYHRPAPWAGAAKLIA